MKIQDVFGSAASGSTGSKTASRNRGGQYLRNRAIPTNPNSARQSNVREGLGTLTPQWANVLTQTQRDAWNLYGQNVPVVDKLGATIKLSGINQFVRSNAPRVQAGLTIVLDAPAIFNVGDTPTLTTFTAAIADGVAIEGAELTPVAGDDNILIYVGRPCSVGVSYFRGPYRFQVASSPDAMTGIYSLTQDVTDLPFPTAVGQRLFIRVQTTRADGRLSADAQGSTVVVA